MCYLALRDSGVTIKYVPTLKGKPPVPSKTLADIAAENPELPQLAFRPSEVAALLGVSLMSVSKYLRNGILPGRKLGGATVVLREELLDSLKNLPHAEYLPPYEPQPAKKG